MLLQDGSSNNNINFKGGLAINAVTLKEKRILVTKVVLM